MKGADSARTWQVVHVEDDADVLRTVADYLHGEEFSFGKLRVTPLQDFGAALALLKERKVDIVILDVLRGGSGRDDRAGLGVLEEWRASGFAPVILHTALAEQVEEHAGTFVRIVPKEAGSLERLAEEMKALFETRIPQIHRAIIDHLDASLRLYMWGFVVESWPAISELTRNGDFIRLLLRRLGVEFTRGIAPLIHLLYPEAPAVDPAPDKIHPVEYYVKPPIGTDPQLGDLRRLVRDGNESLYVVIWPSCDLVTRAGGTQKVDRALVARVRPMTDFDEYNSWASQSAPSKNVKRGLEDLLKNNRRDAQAERFYFLPAAWDVPAGVADLAMLEHVPVQELNSAKCYATIASPFAESMAAQFLRYLARLGTPDLDLDLAMATLPRQGTSPAVASARAATPAPATADSKSAVTTPVAAAATPAPPRPAAATVAEIIVPVEAAVEAPSAKMPPVGAPPELPPPQAREVPAKAEGDGPDAEKP